MKDEVPIADIGSRAAQLHARAKKPRPVIVIAPPEALETAAERLQER